jgi:hypothetical protein
LSVSIKNAKERKILENTINEMMKHPVMNQNIRNAEKNAHRSLAICYGPVQEWEQIYDEDTAFSAGTLFPSLNKPFLGGGR